MVQEAVGTELVFLCRTHQKDEENPKPVRELTTYCAVCPVFSAEAETPKILQRMFKAVEVQGSF